MKVCVTGKMGCGKSTFMEIAKTSKCNVFCADEYVKEIYKPYKKGYKLIYKNFGINFINKDGVIRSKLLDEIIKFPEKEKLLLDLINPLIYKAIKKLDKHKLWFIELGSYLKFEDYFKKLFDKVILIKNTDTKLHTNLKNKYKELNKNHPGLLLDDSKISYNYLIENNNSLSEYEENIKRFLDQTIF